MKSNFLRLSYFAIAAAGMLTACNQENVSSDMASLGNVLSISVSQNDFSPVDAESRAVTDLTNRTTTFENGDKLGLYVVSNADGSYHYENVPFTYNGESWASASTIYYYKNSDYIVYYPYDENLQLTVGETGVSGAIKTVFESKANFYTQNTADAYEAVDLMMAEVENPSDANVNFNLAHKFSMIEISVPVRKYITTKEYNGEKFEYNAPVKLEWTPDLTYGDNKITPYAAGKGIYRFIVKPGTDVAVNIDGYVQYEEEPFNFSNNNAALTLTEGSFKHYKVTVDGISDQVTTRDLEVGDYYYSDGSIYPYGDQEGSNDLSNPMIEGCIGVIFDTEIGAPNTEWTHGSVLALQDKKTEDGAFPRFKWEIATLIGTSYPATNQEEKEKLLQQYNGYELTHNSKFAEVRIVKEVASYGLDSGVNNSGWYIPTVGQYALLIQNMTSHEFNTSGNIVGENTISADNMNIIKNALTKVGGGTQADKSGGYRWWSITEDNQSAYCLNIDKPGLVTRSKNSSNTEVLRAVLSF